MYQYYDTSFPQFSTQTPRAHGPHFGLTNNQYVTPPLIIRLRHGMHKPL